MLIIIIVKVVNSNEKIWLIIAMLDYVWRLNWCPNPLMSWCKVVMLTLSNTINPYLVHAD